MLLFSPYIGGVGIPGGPTGPTFVKKSSSFVAASASTPQTLVHNMASASNVIIARVCLESGSSALDSSIDSGGANLPTIGGFAMTFGALGRISRRHAGIYTYHPNTTGNVTFSISPANGLRGFSVRLDEYSGVDTTTILQANGSGQQNTSASMPHTLTTVDANGVLLGCVAGSDETTSFTVTTPAETIDEENQTGGGAQDIRAGWHAVDVSSASATEGITWDQTGNVSAASALVELKPA